MVINSPLKFSYRIMCEILETAFEEKVFLSPEQADTISKVFKASGGSWERVVQGSVQDITLLKKCMKVFFKLQS